mgnify:FL=1
MVSDRTIWRVTERRGAYPERVATATRSVNMRYPTDGRSYKLSAGNAARTGSLRPATVGGVRGAA